MPRLAPARLAALAAVLLCGAPAAAQDGPQAPVAQTVSRDQQLAAEAYQRGLSEVAQSRLALERAAAPDVRALAEAVLARQEALNRALEAAAGGQLPRVMEPDDAEVAARLGTLQGAAFDDTYLRARAQALMRQANTLDKLAAQAATPALQAAAREALPGIDAVRRQALELRTALAPIGDGPVGAVPGASRPTAQGKDLPEGGERPNATSSVD